MAKEDGFPGEQSFHGNQQHEQPVCKNSACLPSNPTVTAPFTCCSIPAGHCSQDKARTPLQCAGPLSQTLIVDSTLPFWRRNHFFTDIHLLPPHFLKLLSSHTVLALCFSAWWMQPVLLIAVLNTKKRAEERFRFPSSFEIWWSWAWSQLL